jgi:hypothetical protein
VWPNKKKNIFGPLKNEVLDLLIRPPKIVFYQAYSNRHTNDVFVSNKIILSTLDHQEPTFIQPVWTVTQMHIFFPQTPDVLPRKEFWRILRLMLPSARGAWGGSTLATPTLATTRLLFKSNSLQNRHEN